MAGPYELAAIGAQDVLAGVMIVAFFLLAPRLRRTPRWMSKALDPAAPVPQGSGPAVFAPVVAMGSLMAFVLGFAIVWACTAGVVPALAAAAVGWAASALVMRAQRRAGTLPVRWEEWVGGAGSPSLAAWIAASVFAAGCILLWESGAPDTIRAIALGVLAGSCVPWAATGVRLMHDHRRRGARGELA